MNVGDIVYDLKVGTWIVVAIDERTVILTDQICFETFRWLMHDDGIRAHFREATVVRDGKAAGLTESVWVPVAITLHPPPPLVAAHLRSPQALGG
jgi:hypothetical protein